MSTSLPEHALDRLQDRLERLPLRERKKLKTRRAIQDHALRLFTEQGYDETTVEQIAEAAEISPSTFFRYFRTKEDVVITDEYDPIMAEIFRAQPAGTGVIEALRATFREILPQMLAGDMDTVITRMRLTAQVPALRARTTESLREGTHAVLKEIIAERTGRPQDDLDVETFTWALLGVLQSAMYAWLDGKVEIEDLPDLIDHNLELVATGFPL
ncbi:acyl-CoA-like ligand-binding transcription factor [Actinomadura rudentiformis]|uniref:TetR family transcriptional regulator n=1 Tax=Actinomadura rudentiformis TaxID=359158 RepID=A0A6H9YTV5_9ACTN|nr:TetR family transcriptional regulator [Actinomadura rudentiformis]KAB2343977.1 TetR family transcriptional regulator [Actinomadura rudentiformis]